MKKKDEPLRTFIDGGLLHIVVGIEVLKCGAENHPAIGEPGGVAKLAITNPRAFAVAVRQALCDEQEDGSTLVTDMLDAAILKALDDPDLDGAEVS